MAGSVKAASSSGPSATPSGTAPSATPPWATRTPARRLGGNGTSGRSDDTVTGTGSRRATGILPP